ncbi:acetate--CoA ligase family protein, partial [Streptomyces sp. SBT349]|uniref:acetate--CoA ligase family protein n=1 Tax=Streptomyces sp. SBT349 TaxID=1580539 RepID=UPI00066AF161
MVTVVPTVREDPPTDREFTEALLAAVTEAGTGAGKPVVVAHLALDGLAAALSARGLPAYPSAERAVRALAQAVRYARWRAGSTEPGRVPVYDDIDEPAAARLLADAVDPARAEGPLHATPLDADRTRELLAAYGIPVPPVLPAPDADTAVAAARSVGYPVALKPTAPHLRHRADLGG